MTDALQLPVGRFVSGDLTTKRTTGHDGKPLPEDKQRFEFGIAVNKTAPELPAIFATLQQEAMIQHGHVPAVQQFQLQGYSWKITDGDKPNAKGETNSNTAGHFVFWFSSSYPPRTCDQQNAQCDPATVKRGYFVDVVFNARNNGATGTQAGIYLNPEWVRLIAFGEEITGGRSAAVAFANAPVPTQLPPGASATPVASHAAPGMPAAAPVAQAVPVGVTGQPLPGNVAPGVVAPTAAPATPAPAPAQGLPTASPINAAQGLPAPAHDFVDSAITGQVPGQPLPGMPS